MPPKQRRNVVDPSPPRPPLSLLERLTRARTQYEELHRSGATLVVEKHFSGPLEAKRRQALLAEQVAILEDLALTHVDETDEEVLRHAAQLISLLQLLARLSSGVGSE